MLRTLRLSLTFPEAVRADMSMGSVLHGAWMELLPTDYVEILHGEGLRPYSQSLVLAGGEQAVWRLGFLTEEAYQMAALPLLAQTSLFLKQKGYGIGLRLEEERQSAYEDLADRAFHGAQSPRRGRLRFLTATSFRQNGRYRILPDAALLFGSLLRRWNAFSPVVKLEEDGLEEILAASSSWSRYHLRSRFFSLEGQKINGFSGDWELRFHGTDMERRLMALLLFFAPFSGVGIKTALGMGAVETAVW